jgi:penicillin-binding protein 1C
MSGDEVTMSRLPQRLRQGWVDTVARAKAQARRLPLPWRAALSALLAAALMLRVLDALFPLPPEALHPSREAQGGALVVLAEDGTPLRTWASADGALRQPIALSEVSPHYLQALLGYEDRAYRWHGGINPYAMARAAWQWFRNGRIVSGGSTLTMQVARILEPPEQRRSLAAKASQMARALQLEWHLSKDDILTLYLNRAPMGGQIQGVEMASRSYLGKPAKELSPAEAALLVALPQLPSRLRPDRAPAAAQAARDKVLRRMQVRGLWQAEVVNDALLERVFAPPLRARWLAPLAAERLRQEALAAPPASAAASAPKTPSRATTHPPARPTRTPGGTLASTLDAGVQMRLEQILLDRLPSLPDAVSIAALVVDNHTLAVKGYAGSADFSDAKRAAHVDMVRAPRSPGSTLKPFLYALALDEGLVHSESLLIDAPQNFGGYTPGNFQAEFSGPVSLSQALQRSLNVPAVDLLERLGPERLTAQLRNAGLKLRMAAGAKPNLSLILGGADTTLEELVGAYTALGRAGVAARPRLRPQDPLTEARLMSPGAAFIIREILENGGRPGNPFIETRQRVAWKTGTSFGFRDAWAVGVTDRFTVGVWVGRPDGTPNPGYFGANTAAPLLKDIFAALGNQATQARVLPASVSEVDICWPLGLAASSTAPEHCLQRRSAYALAGGVPPTLPDRVRPGSLLETARFQVNSRGEPIARLSPGCEPAASTASARSTQTAPALAGTAASHSSPASSGGFARWPALLEPWLDASDHSALERLPLASHCRTAATQASLRRSLRISGIEPGSVLRPAPNARQVRLTLKAIGSKERITWLLDGAAIGSTQPGQPLLTLTLGPAQAGSHALTALDTQGRYERLTFRMQVPAAAPAATP